MDPIQAALQKVRGQVSAYSNPFPEQANLGQMGLALPPPAKSKRDLLGEELMGKFLYDMMLSPSAMRGNATAIGQLAGGAGAGLLTKSPAAAVAGHRAGGMAGSVAMQQLQRIAPTIFGEPPVDESMLANAVVDDLGTMAGGMAGKGLFNAGKFAIDLMRGKAGLQAKFAGKVLGENPYNIPKTDLLDESGLVPTDTVGSVAKDLMARDFPIAAPQLMDSPMGINIFSQSKPGKEFLMKQDAAVKKLADELLEPGVKNNPIQTNVNTSLDAVVKMLQEKTGWVPASTNPRQALRKVVESTTNFKKFMDEVGPNRARVALMQDWFEHAYVPKERVFDVGRLSSYMHKNRAVFNSLAEAAEKSSKQQFRPAGVPPVKASDLKASWNRFVHAAEFASKRAGRGETRALEMESVNAAMGAAASALTTGVKPTYPATRAAGVFSKIGWIGPGLAKAWANPKMVNDLTRLMETRAGSLAQATALKNLGMESLKQGIRVMGMTQGGKWVDARWNPSRQAFEVSSNPINDETEFMDMDWDSDTGDNSIPDVF